MDQKIASATLVKQILFLIKTSNCAFVLLYQFDQIIIINFNKKLKSIGTNIAFIIEGMLVVLIFIQIK